MLENLSEYMGLFLQFANICVILWAFRKFLSKPHDTMDERQKLIEKRVDAQELKILEIEKSLLQGNDKFREQARTNKAFQSVMLSFVNFEIAYCMHTDYNLTDELLKAKNTLENYINNCD